MVCFSLMERCSREEWRSAARMRTLAVATVIALGIGVADVHAQNAGTLSDVIGFLVTNQAVQTADFEKDRAAAEVARDTISRALLINLTSVPIATSSSG